MLKKAVFAFFASTCLFFVDRLAKSAFFGFSGICNGGISFGFFAGWGLFLTVVGLLLFFYFTFLLREVWGGQYFLLGLGMFLAGAVSNILDRMYYGCVRDIFDFFGWFVFNISDGLLFLGALCMAWSIVVWKDKQMK